MKQQNSDNNISKIPKIGTLAQFVFVSANVPGTFSGGIMGDWVGVVKGEK